ncbi:hypothetical protein BBO99_00000588 [Phytophthora kernoviae]|uniref:Uncharacterized protein n=2 Tax=Phytophthora kernoviae TaxID=325452 RepID=A0A3R7IIN2_9STRA|nr:hypothetical protein G195_001595 [Phytophthora kernoviae 00238/432]KAG2523613.1 hypothetical protein JM16_005316 [Phytophthora kernoviae]KAG2532893.1 hypothetical protein JM18_000937 [Phytophthora kernoviae]RLN20484.1 hypothetical protein BBI17_005483 [Phytophthora kernoviae]RLN85359.1 hypothetical protein BBO99_00000588 [Phytophthora kernoviae]
MNEEEEFGMSKTSRDADPMEQEGKSSVKAHPDFNFLNAEEIRAAVESEDKRSVPQWMTHLPVEKDPSQWTILEVQIRPDRAWEVIKELIATVCISKGLLMNEEHANSVLFRKKVTQESVAHGVANTATFLNVFVRIGVSPAKLRVVDICTLVSDENKLLGGIMPTGKSALWTVHEPRQSLTYALDQLLGALQSTLLSQCLSLSHLYMSTPENSMDSAENAELDEGYVTDLKRAFSRTNVLLYEASCMVNGIPVTLHVTYGNLIYRTMVPVFASTTVIPFEDVVNVVQTTSFGIQVVYVELDATKHAKGITIAMGLEVDLLYQLLFEVGGLMRLGCFGNWSSYALFAFAEFLRWLQINAMHQHEAKENANTMPPLQQQETEKNPTELKKILGPEEEETKEDDGPAPIDDSSTTAN